MPVIDKIDPPIIEPDKVQPAPRDGRDDPVVVNADTARQGPAGRRVLYVVAAGTIGALLVLALAYLAWFG